MATAWQPFAEYDPDADAIYVYLRDTETARTVAVDDFRNIDYAQDGAVVGIEFLDVSGGVDLHDIPFAQRVEELIGDLNLGIQIFA